MNNLNSTVINPAFPLLTENYNLMFIVNGTQSTYTSIQNLLKIFPQILYLVQLTNIFNRVSILIYGGEDETKIFEWSDWSKIQNFDSVIKFASEFEARNYNRNEKSEGLNATFEEVLKNINESTIGILYTDIFPICRPNYRKRKHKCDRLIVSNENLFNWDYICCIARKKNLRIFSIVFDIKKHDLSLFYKLSKKTRGKLIHVKSISLITEAIIGIILNIGGVEFAFDEGIKCTTLTEEYTKIYLKNYNQEEITNYIEFSNLKILPIETLKIQMCDLVNFFSDSNEYRKIVCSLFDWIVTPENVISLTYNTVFIQFWRVICSKNDSSEKELVNKFNMIIKKATPNVRRVLMSFTEGAYNKIKDIDLIIQKTDNTGFSYIMKTFDKNITRKILFELRYTFTPTNLKSILNLIRGIKTSKTDYCKEMNIAHVPVNLEDDEIFQLIPHLINHGTMFSKRLAPIMAALSILSDSILKENAKRYLKSIKGKWIQDDLLKDNSLEYACLLMKVSEFALTEYEEKCFNSFILMELLRKYKNNEIVAKVVYPFNNSKIHDHINKCKNCNQWRPLTLILDNACLVCIEYLDKEYLEEEKSINFIFECTKCRVDYISEDPYEDQICCYCRENKKTQNVKCVSCKNKFIYQKLDHSDNLMCVTCSINNKQIDFKHKITINDYFTQNNSGFIGVHIENIKCFFSDTNNAINTTLDEGILSLNNFPKITEEDFEGHKIVIKNNSFDVLNVKDIQKQIYDSFKGLDIYQCTFCKMHFLENELLSMCGYKSKSCNGAACKTCLKNWYNQLKPGMSIISISLLCLSCKKLPTPIIVQEYNEDLYNAMMNINEINLNYIYGWCIKCNYITKHNEMDSNYLDQTNLPFICIECSVGLLGAGDA